MGNLLELVLKILGFWKGLAERVGEENDRLKKILKQELANYIQEKEPDIFD